ncbi:MAG: polysulfide reductase NrfD [Candidatus Omnitrophica bacterium]|nr:polysulfide reductase NrfD [Candidatus Omnitrophota bacterium]
MSQPSRLESDLITPITRFSPGFFAVIGCLLVVIAVAAYAWLHQLVFGLGMTGLNRPVFWGIYITNFVFFIGISHAGTLISAILRLCRAEWRRPITRMAEAITVLVLFIGAGNILMDLGRPDRALNVLLHPNFRSPLLWDVTSITTYLTASTLYLYLPLIPDLALLRDRVPKRRWFYRLLALGWTGTPRQQHWLEVAISIMAVLVIPIAITVHTVVSWVFAMTVQPMWHSTIFGPYFVVGAIFSGIAALIIAMAVIRKAYRLEAYLKPIHFNNLAVLLLVMACCWFYFTFAEYLTTFYGNEPDEMQVFWSKITGPYAPYFWTMVACCFVVPVPILALRKGRSIPGTVIASVLVLIGMWLERFLIVVPSLINPRLPYRGGIYHPTWVEGAITAGAFAMFLLFYCIFAKLFPVIAIWEIREGQERGIPETVERLKTYLPTEGPAGAAQPATERWGVWR